MKNLCLRLITALVVLTASTGHAATCTAHFTSAETVAVTVGAVTTFAGMARQQGALDGTGLGARFYEPHKLAVDQAGNLYVADRRNHVIRKITPAGVVTTLAGAAGLPGFADGSGSVARFRFPSGLAVDSGGNLYVADTDNHRIRKITPSGTVTTLSGSSNFGNRDGTVAVATFTYPKGIAVDDAGNLYVTHNHSLRKISAAGIVTTLAGSTLNGSGNVDGVGTVARFDFPMDVAVDASGNLYVADMYNHTIRKVTPSGVVSTFAGSPGVSGSSIGVGSSALFADPTGITIDSAGNLYVADRWNHLIRKITPAGLVTNLAGTARLGGAADGTGSLARFQAPADVAIDTFGNLYVADKDNHTIRMITPGSGDEVPDDGVVSLAPNQVVTLAGTPLQYGLEDGFGADARFRSPQGVAVDSAGNVYVADTSNHVIRKITPSGDVSTLAGDPTWRDGDRDGSGSQARFFAPEGVAVDSAGNVYVADTGNHKIRKITPGGLVSTLAEELLLPGGVTVDSAGNLFVVTDRGDNVIRKITPDGVITTFAGSPNSSGDRDGVGADALFRGLKDIVVDAFDNLYVIDIGNGKIRKIAANGSVTTFALLPIGSSADSLAVDRKGNMYLTDEWDHTVGKITQGGVFSVVAGKSEIIGHLDAVGADARFRNPQGIAVDSFGNLYVAERGNGTIRKIGSSLETGGGGGSGGGGDSPDNSSESPVVTLAGNFFEASHRDGIGTDARFYLITDMVVDAAGNAYISEQNGLLNRPGVGNVIRKLTPAGVVTTLAGAPGTYSGAVEGPALSVRFTNPSGLAMGASGDLYISDDTTIRKLAPDGTVTLLAGAPNEIGGADGEGSAARFTYPKGLALDPSGNLFVADTGNQVIRKITPDGHVSTFAGGHGQLGHADGLASLARFRYPAEIEVDADGNLYVADTGNLTIRKITPAGLVSTLAGAPGQAGDVDGPGTTARFREIRDLSFDSLGNIFVTDGGSGLRKITPAGIVSRTHEYNIHGTQTVAFASETTAYVVSGHAVQKVTPSSPDGILEESFLVETIAGLAGTPGSTDGIGNAARFHFPRGVAVDSQGNVFVSDEFNHVIRKISPDGEVVTFAGSVGLSGNQNGTGVGARFNSPAGLAIDASDNLYVGEYRAGTIRKITPAGVVTTLVSSGVGFSLTRTFGVDAAGNIYVPDTLDRIVRKVSPDGSVSPVINAATGTAFTSLSAGPFGVAVDRSDNVLVSEILDLHGLVRRISPTGVVSTVGGSVNGTFGSPDIIAPTSYPLAVAPNNDIYLADQHRVVRVAADGLVTTLAGHRSANGSADGPGTEATFGWITGLAVDANGAIYVADHENHVIRKITISRVTKEQQTIDFKPLADRAIGASFTLAATATSGLPVSFEVVSGPATLSGPTLTLTGPGTVTVRASQPGSSAYAAATPLEHSFSARQPSLSSLQLSGATIQPGFDPAITTYKVSVSNSTASISITPSTTIGSTSIKVNGVLVKSSISSLGIPLKVGSNTITVIIASRNGSNPKTYTVVVDRAASSVSTLSNLLISKGKLSPKFKASRKLYAVNVPHSAKSIRLTPAAKSKEARIKVNRFNVASGKPSRVIPLKIGKNRIEVQVTAQNGTKRTYRITVTRATSRSSARSTTNIAVFDR
jgi:sugar lactone lactonase YvrE